MRVDLAPLSTASSTDWKDFCRHSLEKLRRSVYVDKDLVLPVMSSTGRGETFFVAASTDLAGADVMMKRIRQQLSDTRFDATGHVRVSATAVPLPSAREGRPLVELVRIVADRLTEATMLALAVKSVIESANEPRSTGALDRKLN
jgi:hypothetical protein